MHLRTWLRFGGGRQASWEGPFGVQGFRLSWPPTSSLSCKQNPLLSCWERSAHPPALRISGGAISSKVFSQQTQLYLPRRVILMNKMLFSLPCIVYLILLNKSPVEPPLAHLQTGKLSSQVVALRVKYRTVWIQNLHSHLLYPAFQHHSDWIWEREGLWGRQGRWLNIRSQIYRKMWISPAMQAAVTYISTALGQQFLTLVFFFFLEQENQTWLAKVTNTLKQTSSLLEN